MLVRIDPPLIGQILGRGDRDVEQLVLASRLVGDSLFPIKKWPAFVYVCLPPKSVSGDSVVRRIRDDELSPMAWGELYPTAKDAQNKIIG
jgi:hypothetical protein